jgi:hypothetical protein
MRSVSGVARQAFRLAHHSAAFTAKIYAHGTDGELAPDWATAPLKVVVDRSFRSGETTPGVDDEPDNSLPELREVERETAIRWREADRPGALREEPRQEGGTY